jgi:hypothetical protein
MNRIVWTSMVGSVAATGPAQGTLAQWDLEGDTTAASGGINSASGSAVLQGGTTATFATGWTGAAAGARGWNTSTSPARGTGNKTAGLAFFVSTAGFEAVPVRRDHRHSNTAPRLVRLHFTIDGGMSWIDHEGHEAVGGDTWHARSSEFPVLTNNWVDFGFRIVSEQDSDGNYLASVLTSNHTTTGTRRFDNLEVQAVPESARLACLARGGRALLGRRRAR